MRLDAGKIGKKFTDDIQQIQVLPIVPNFEISSFASENTKFDIGNNIIGLMLET